MKHTTGPWNSTRPIPENNEFLRFVRSPTFEHIAYICALGEDTREARANAHLIAAAPDLLAALEYLRECIENGTEPAMSAVNAAISKAKGEFK